MRSNILTSLMMASLLVSTEAAGPLPNINSQTPFLLYYGNWNATAIQNARDNYRVVVLEPSSNISAANIQTIQYGPDGLGDTIDDVLVFGYLSIGEDSRPSSPVEGNGAGPRVDPRPDPLNDPITDVVTNSLELGNPSPGGTGFASYYLDANEDGTPDSNPTFGGYYVNPGDPEWMIVLENMTRSIDGRSGIKEILTTTYGAGLGMDGIFIDTIDTAAPNGFGGTQYEWTAPSFTQALADIHATYPDHFLFLNRGLFYFSPTFEHYQFNPRSSIHALLFESYFTDSTDGNIVTPFFDSNKYLLAPKLNAEASFPDGFTIFALGYDNPSSIPPAIQEQDFIESHREQGWPLYRSIFTLDQIRTDAASWNSMNPDTSPPVWDSTAAFSEDSDSDTPGNQPPIPREGVQAVSGRDGSLTVYWDVARDQTGPVQYHLYYQQGSSLDFATAFKITDIQPEIAPLYESTIGFGSYPFQYTLTGLMNQTEYSVAIRAADRSIPSLEESNTKILSAIPVGVGYYKNISIDGDFSDWADVPLRAVDAVGDQNNGLNDFRSLKIANDESFVYFLLESDTGSSFFTNARNSIFFDTDENFSTGFQSASSIGSEFLIQGITAYDQRDRGFANSTIPSITISTGVSPNGLLVEFALNRSATFESLPNGAGPVFPDGDFNVAFTSDQPNFLPGDIFSPFGIPYQFAAISTIDAWLLLE